MDGEGEKEERRNGKEGGLLNRLDWREDVRTYNANASAGAGTGAGAGAGVT